MTEPEPIPRAPGPARARADDEPRSTEAARPGRTVSVSVDRWGMAEARGAGFDSVVTEEPLEIRVGGPGREATPLAVTMRTPGHDFELAVGFLLGEGIVPSVEGIRSVRYCAPEGEPQLFNVVTVDLADGTPFDVERFRRNVYTSSSCGLCGKASIDRLRTQGLRPPSATLRVSAETLSGLPDRLREQQAVFARTGGLHATGFAEVDGRLRCVREDVGRHNAFDKVVGRMALDGALPGSTLVAVVSGRASFELVQKAIVAGVPILAAIGAPSHLAVDLAREYGVTLVGFLRPDGFTVYSGTERIVREGNAGAPGPSLPLSG